MSKSILKGFIIGYGGSGNDFQIKIQISEGFLEGQNITFYEPGQGAVVEGELLKVLEEMKSRSKKKEVIAAVEIILG